MKFSWCVSTAASEDGALVRKREETSANKVVCHEVDLFCMSSPQALTPTELSMLTIVFHTCFECSLDKFWFEVKKNPGLVDTVQLGLTVTGNTKCSSFPTSVL